MTWDDIRTTYPHQFIIIQAHQWEDEGDVRHILDMSVVESQCPENTLLQTCSRLAHEYPEQQLYPTYTGWETPRIGTPKRRTRAGVGYAHHPSAHPAEPTTHPSRTPRIL